jgi:signal peptidase II
MIVDQLTKYWAEHILRADVIAVLPVFDLSLVHNTGAAFGIGNGYGGWQHVFFVNLALVVSGVLLLFIKQLKSQERHLAIAYSLIVAGALGNAIDRLIYQYVVDFIHWFYRDWHYPHFNVADIAIFIGAALIIADAFGKPFLNIKKASL